MSGSFFTWLMLWGIMYEGNVRVYATYRFYFCSTPIHTSGSSIFVIEANGFSPLLFELVTAPKEEL